MELLGWMVREMGKSRLTIESDLGDNLHPGYRKSSTFNRFLMVFLEKQLWMDLLKLLGGYLWVKAYYTVSPAFTSLDTD